MFHLTNPGTNGSNGDNCHSLLGFQPGRLWSLWDIMHSLDFGRLLGALGMISSLGPGAESAWAQRPKDFRLLRRDYDSLIEHSGYLREVGEAVELHAAVSAVDHLLSILRRADISSVPGEAIFNIFDLELLRTAPGAVNSHFRDGLRSQIALVISPANANYFVQRQPLFGVDVQSKFPSVIYEIEEAGKCYALERSSACAFHAIRCLEAGIRALSRCLKIPDPTRASDRNWGAMLKLIKDEIERRWPGSSTRLSGDGEFFDNAYAALASMQNPWRNATMHLDQKYTEEEAQNIFEVVKGFMRRIASRMDEDGQPLA